MADLQPKSGFVRIHVRRQVRLGHLNFEQFEMSQIGRVGLAAVKARIAAHTGPDDQPSKPLTRNYAIWKTRQGKGKYRNLRLTGAMLQNLTLRSVSENAARAGFTTKKQRQKAQANTNIEPFVIFSPKNAIAVMAAAEKRFHEKIGRLVVGGYTFVKA